MGKISLVAVNSIAILLVAALASCGPQGTAAPLATQGPNLAPLQSLDNTAWVLTSLNGSSPIEGLTVTLRFGTESLLRGHAGCNWYGVSYATDGSRFLVPQIQRTQDVCDTPAIMQQEAVFFEALANVAAYRATEERLEFADEQGRTTLTFARLHATTGSVLPGTKWELAALRGQRPLSDTHIDLEFEAQSFGGYTGCNYYGGGPDSGGYAATDDGNLKFLTFEVTLIGCPEGIAAQETAYIDALASVESYRLVDDRLELRDSAGETVLVYARWPECAEEPADLEATAWQLISVEGQAPTVGSTTTLAFVDDKWFVEHARCDAYISSYQASGHKLGVSLSAWLGGICPDREGQDVTLLESPSEACPAQGRLQITTASGRAFVYEPLPEAAQIPLEGPAWILLSFVGERQIEGEAVPWPDPSTLREGTEITLILEGGTARGSAGCNDYVAAYTLDGTSLAVADITATEKACLTPEGVTEQERRYLDALKDVTGYRSYGTLLWLRTEGGDAMAFTAQRAK